MSSGREHEPSFSMFLTNLFSLLHLHQSLRTFLFYCNLAFLKISPQWNLPPFVVVFLFIDPYQLAIATCLLLEKSRLTFFMFLCGIMVPLFSSTIHKYPLEYLVYGEFSAELAQNLKYKTKCCPSELCQGMSICRRHLASCEYRSTHSHVPRSLGSNARSQ